MHQIENKLKNQFKNDEIIKVTKQMHIVQPIAKNKLKLFYTLKKPTEIILFEEFIIENFDISSNIPCIYEKKLWIGLVVEKGKENDDVRVQIMHPLPANQNYFCPQVNNSCWIIKQIILITLSILHKTIFIFILTILFES